MDASYWDYSTYGGVAASESDVLKLYGIDAENLWTYLESQAVVVNLEAKAVQATWEE